MQESWEQLPQPSQAQGATFSSPMLPAQLQPLPPSHHRGVLAEHQEASERQALSLCGLTLQVPRQDLQDAVTPFIEVQAVQYLKVAGQ